MKDRIETRIADLEKALEQYKVNLEQDRANIIACTARINELQSLLNPPKEQKK